MIRYCSVNRSFIDCRDALSYAGSTVGRRAAKGEAVPSGTRAFRVGARGQGAPGTRASPRFGNLFCVESFSLRTRRGAINDGRAGLLSARRGLSLLVCIVVRRHQRESERQDFHETQAEFHEKIERSIVRRYCKLPSRSLVST